MFSLSLSTHVLMQGLALTANIKAGETPREACRKAEGENKGVGDGSS